MTLERHGFKRQTQSPERLHALRSRRTLGRRRPLDSDITGWLHRRGRATSLVEPHNHQFEFCNQAWRQPPHPLDLTCCGFAVDLMNLGFRREPVSPQASETSPPKY